MVLSAQKEAAAHQVTKSELKQSIECRLLEDPYRSSTEFVLSQQGFLCGIPSSVSIRKWEVLKGWGGYFNRVSPANTSDTVNIKLRPWQM
jgi:hypothetical protein